MNQQAVKTCKNADIFSCHAQVGWFLHTPFPSSEIYRTLPVREEVLRAVLKADLIGFHTYDYARHFVSACTRILGLEVSIGKHAGNLLYVFFYLFICLFVCLFVYLFIHSFI